MTGISYLRAGFRHGTIFIPLHKSAWEDKAFFISAIVPKVKKAYRHFLFNEMWSDWEWIG